jgi:hypothetical protein
MWENSASSKFLMDTLTLTQARQYDYDNIYPTHNVPFKLLLLTLRR